MLEHEKLAHKSARILAAHGSQAADIRIDSGFVEQFAPQSRGIGTDLQPDTGVPLGFTRFELDREQADEFDGLVCTSHDIDQGPNRFLTVSEQAVAHLADGQRVFPVGTVIYKAYHSKAGGRMVFAVMRKREAGFDPEHHDWAYLYGESYQPYEIGRVERCAACHSRAASQDYVFSRAP